MRRNENLDGDSRRLDGSPLVDGPAWYAGVIYKILCVSLLSGAVLLLAFNPILPYEQDQGSKLAVIYKLQAQGWSSLLQPPLYYKENQQPLYYLVSYLLFPVLGPEPYGAMNMVSVIMGGIFVGAVTFAVHKAFSVSCWITALLMVSTPMFVLTFTYSNEMAVAMCFVGMALACNAAPWRFGGVFSGFFCGLAFWSYLPIALLGPLFLWWVYFSPSDLPPKARIGRVLKIGVVFLGTAIAFWCVFVRQVPMVFPFEDESSWQYKAAVLAYGSNPGVLLVSFLSVTGYFTFRLRKAFPLLLGYLPVFFFPGVFSHKHLFICSLAIVVPAAIAVERSRRWLRCACLALVGLWFLVSASPFGVYGPLEGANMFFPTNDGPCPTGAYLGFYGNIKRGLYQEQYADEIYGVEKGIDALAASGFRSTLAGNFNDHFLYPYLYELRRPEWATRIQLGPKDRWPYSGRFLMIRRSYLHSNLPSEESNRQLDAWLEKGKVRIVESGDTEIFPVVIEVGDDVPDATERALGRRILFARRHSGYNGLVATKSESDAFNPLYWVPAAQAKGIPAAAVYSDPRFSAFSRPVPGASAWRLLFPRVLFQYSKQGATEPR